jgi:hypothetical protein
MQEALTGLARTTLDRLLEQLRAGVTRTPQIDAALVRLEAATAELVAWVQTAPVREPGDSPYTPIGPWVQAVDDLQAAINPEDPDEAGAVAEVDHFTPPDTPLEEWIAGVERLLAELDKPPNRTDWP